LPRPAAAVTYDLRVKQLVVVAALLGCLFDSAPRAAAEGTWSGRISDSACGAKHEAAAEGEDKMPDGDCTRTCVRGGSKYVVVADNGTIYKIANQDFAELAPNAGRSVKVTGDLNGDAITVRRDESRESRVASRESRVASRESGVESRESGVESRELSAKLAVFSIEIPD
jgi:hypothetical protein